MASLRELVFLSCIWCVSSQTTNMTEGTESPNSTIPPITEIVTEMNTTEAPSTIIGATTLMTSLRQTAGATTSAATVAMETGDLKSTQRGTSNVVGTTFITTETKSPSSLSSSVVALITVIAFIVFILVLAAIVCRKRALAQKIKRRFTHRDTKLSIHRPESGMILDDDIDRTQTSSFNADRSKLDKICHENPVFLSEKDGNMQSNGASNKATLPSTASLKVANETAEDSKVPSNETIEQNGHVKIDTASGVAQDTNEGVKTDPDSSDLQNTDNVPSENINNETTADEAPIKPVEDNTDDSTVKATENDDVTNDVSTKTDDAKNDDAQVRDDENNTDKVASQEPLPSNSETDDNVQEMQSSDQNSNENNNEQTKSESQPTETPTNASDKDFEVLEI